MTKKQLINRFNEIKTFMWLDNWIFKIEYKDLKEEDAYVWSIMYSYFKALIVFSNSLLEEDDEYITHIIFHELSHIYTSNTLSLFEGEEEFLIHYIWQSTFTEFKNKFVHNNEQQTELLARRFKELYKDNK